MVSVLLNKQPVVLSVLNWVQPKSTSNMELLDTQRSSTCLHHSCITRILSPVVNQKEKNKLNVNQLLLCSVKGSSVPPYYQIQFYMYQKTSYQILRWKQVRIVHFLSLLYVLALLLITAEIRGMFASHTVLLLHLVHWRRRLWIYHTTWFQSHFCS